MKTSHKKYLQNIKSDFPIFSQNSAWKNLVYLDNAATSQKPKQVINSIVDYYSSSNANPHRGVYELSVKSTEVYKSSRQKISKFIDCKPEELIFTKGATDSLNGIAFSLSKNFFLKNQAILITVAEHHSVLVPLQQLAQSLKLKLLVVPVNSQGILDILEYERLLKTNDVRLIAFTHASNVLGTINPVKELVKIARKESPSSLILLDACQSVGHLPVSFKDLSVDFLVFSGHKILGPMGIGALVAKKEILEKLSPFSFGGDMVDTVTINKTTFASIPRKFEAGTPNVQGAVGLASAVDYLQNIGLSNIRKHEAKLVKLTLAEFEDLDFIRILGPTKSTLRNGLISFNVNKVHSHDVAWILDQQNIAIRAGHHCAMPLHHSMNVSSSARASFYVYNDESDVSKLVEGLKKVNKVFS